MARKATPKAPKPSRISLDRQREAGRYVRAQTQGLRTTVANIKARLAPQTTSVFSSWKDRFIQAGGALQYNNPEVADEMLADPKRAKRLTNLARAENRLEQREARVDAEPQIAAGRRAGKAHGASHKEELVGERTERAAKKRRGEETKGATAARFDTEVAEAHAQLGSDAQTAPLVPIFDSMAKHLFGKGTGKTSLLDKFAAWAGSHAEELQAMLADAAAVPSSKLAASRARYDAAQEGAPRSSKRGAPRSSKRGAPRSSKRGAPRSSQRGGASASA